MEGGRKGWTRGKSIEVTHTRRKQKYRICYFYLLYVLNLDHVLWTISIGKVLYVPEVGSGTRQSLQAVSPHTFF